MTVQRGISPLTFFNSIGRGHGEIRYRDLAEQLGDALFIASPRSGLFLYVNHKALELTGYTRDELGSKGLSELFSPREAAEALESIRELEPGATRHLQNVPLRARNGKVTFADIRVTAPVDADEPVVILLARDSAERLMSEQNAGRRRESLVAIADLLALFANRKQDSLDEVLQLCHRALLADCVAFYRPTATQSGNMALVHAINVPDDFPVALNQADAVLADTPLIWHAGDRPTSALSRAARSAGLTTLHLRQAGGGLAATSGLFVAGYRPANSQLSRSPEVAALVNITTEWLGAYLAAQQQNEISALAEKRLATTGRELSLVLEESSEGVLRVDRDGRLLEINPAAETLLGFRAADTLHAPLDDVLVSAQLLARPLLDAIKQGLRWGGVETDLVRRDGSSVAVFLRALPLTDEQNKFDGGLVIFADRTDQKQFQAQSDHLERRAWLGDLSAIFAHDVRNPLNGISAGLSLLATKFAPSDPLADAVSKMQAEVVRVDQLLKNVLLVAKPAELHYQPVQLVQLLERVITRWTPRLARYNIQLSFRADPATPLAVADAHQMDQVFTNLVVNAVDAMGQNGGTLSIHCHPADHAKAPRGDYVEILFGDTGPGIPTEILLHVFDPFITTKADGTGLGLAIAKRIVTAHKGAIFAQSWPGIGTAFHLFIPVAK